MVTRATQATQADQATQATQAITPLALVTANGQLARLPGFLVGDVQEVAQQGVDACLRGDAVCVPGAVNRAAAVASRGAPKWLVRRLGGLLARKAV